MTTEADIRIMRDEKDLIGHSGFKDGRWPQDKECWQPPEAGRCRKVDSPLEPPGRNTALILPSETHFELLTSRFIKE